MLAFGKLSKSLSTKKVFTPRNGVQRRLASNTSFPSYLLNIPQTKVTTLSNGLRVATEENFGETATVGVFIDTGSRYENAQNNGVAHYLEHMAFKGTSNRSKNKLEVEIENMGGTLNAYTSREQTVYYMKAFKNDVPKAVEIVSDILTNSKYDPSHIESERSTILREMEEVGKDYSETIFDHLHAAAYQGTSLGRTILGPAENISKISREDLVNYVKNHYHAPRFVLAGAGSIKHEDLVSLGNKYFGGLPTGKDSTYAKEAAKFTGSQITVRDDTMEDLHVAVAVEGVSWTDPDYFAFLVLQQMISAWDRTIGGGKNLSSFLCERVAVEGLAKSVSAFNTCYSDTGLFGVYSVTDAEKAEDLTFEILREFNRIGKNAHDAEVDRAKSRLKASLLMQLDGSTAVFEDIGRQMLTYGRRLTPAEIFMRIDAITTKDIMRVASEHCEDVEPAVVAVGPTAHFPDYNMIREWTYWRRW